ncbi:MAG: hypothetical protein M1829_001238 [Trizodia sp. TS-e1964]|nr:MAG: hypothetical protein M1829_001238 [Trizodia sp. TS-e1964]
MPAERQSARPISGAACKSIKPPTTPKLGIATPFSQSPALRRAAPDQITTPKANNREELSTPVKSFLNANITPRSSSRKSRVDSSFSTPNITPDNTPTSSKAVSNIELSRSTPGASNSGASYSDIDWEKPISTRPRSLINDSSRSGLATRLDASQSQLPRGQPRIEPEGSPRFFYANEAKIPLGNSRNPPGKPVYQNKISNFIYANGENLQGASSSNTPAPYHDSSQEQYFRAEGPAETLSPRPGNVGGSSRKIQSTRPPSPPKPHYTPQLSPLRGLSPLASPPFGRQLASSSIARQTAQFASPTGSLNRTLARQINPAPAARRRSHVRSVSASSLDSIISANNSIYKQPPNALAAEEPILAVAVLESITANESPILKPTQLAQSKPEPLSPGLSPSQTKPYQTNDLAATARTERKILDLEITNSSLSAINRSYEREIRKQKAELRRFRRLSRSGRLSTVSVSMSSTRSRLSNITDDDKHANLSDMTEEEEEEEEDDDDDTTKDNSDDEELSASEGSSCSSSPQRSPGAIEASDARHRFKDEKRLQLDLHKHQQMLIDGQKMNQSLKRCLTWTDELISEGRKALAYQVRVNDLQLASRVLPPPEDSEEADSEEEEEVGGFEEGDRDSGVEVEEHQGLDDGFGRLLEGEAPG